MPKSAGLVGKKGSGGFTIVELLMATAVFSLVLLVAVIGFIQVGKMFYKSVEIGKTSDTAGNILDSVTTDFRSVGSGDLMPDIANPPLIPNSGNETGYLCIGSHRYTYFLSEYQPGSIINLNSPLSPVGLIRDDISLNSSCLSPYNAGSYTWGPGAQQMLGDGMSLGKFYISQPNAASFPALYQVKIAVGFGDNGSQGVFSQNINETDPASPGVPSKKMVCRGVLGTNFCAVSNLDAFVTKGQALQ